MLEFLPERYPLKVCLLDCGQDNLFDLEEYLDQNFDQCVHILPTLLCAVRSRDYVSTTAGDDKKTVDSSIKMFAKRYSEGICIFCILTLCI